MEEEIIYNRCDGVILKLTKIGENKYIDKYGIVIDLDKCAILGKTSQNIIDLIEVGDYVNGREVVEFDCEDETILAFPIYTPDGLFNTIECYVPLEEFEIKTILTKEQYEANCYEVK